MKNKITKVMWKKKKKTRTVGDVQHIEKQSALQRDMMDGDNNELADTDLVPKTPFDITNEDIDNDDFWEDDDVVIENPDDEVDLNLPQTAWRQKYYGPYLFGIFQYPPLLDHVYTKKISNATSNGRNHF